MRKLFIYFCIFLLVALLGLGLSPYLRVAAFNIGLLSEEIPVSGTGSMYPTFPKSEGISEKAASEETVARPLMKKYPSGFSLFGRHFFDYRLKRGDIVEFENEVTRKITRDKYNEASGFVKRIVALPGDDIEVRDGFLYINGRRQEEPYTAKPRSTYGGDFLPDCRLLKIPENYVFVMGDNRKASLDSRHDIAFLPEKDIHYVLPYANQDIYKNLWRDASRDEQYAHSTTLAAVEFVSALNAEREKRHLKKLNLDNLLSQSGTIRAKAILESDDFSTEATRSGLDLSRSVAKSGYRNIILGELLTRGFYESEELMENFREFPQSAELLYSDEYQDIGVSSVIDEIRGCPTQAVVIHLGGYKPPNYDKDEVAGWGSLIDNLREVTPSWEKLKGADTINQEKLGRLLYLLNIRLDNAVRIHDRLSKNQWLTEDEEKLVSMDKDLHNEAQNLINELNRP